MKLDIEFDGDLPEGFTPLEGIVVLKGFDSDGDVAIQARATENLSTWESMGMLLYVKDVIHKGWQSPAEEGD